MKETMKALAQQDAEYQKLLEFWQKFCDKLTPCVVINTHTGEVRSLVDVWVKASFVTYKYHGKVDISEFYDKLQPMLHE